MEYSHTWPATGGRMVPSTFSAVKLGNTLSADDAPDRTWCRQPGQTFALSRIVALQCGQLRVFPGVR